MARRRMTRVASMQGSTDEALRAMQDDNSAEDAEARRIRGDIYKMLDQGTASITDLWAPPRMKILYDNIEMGDEALAVYTISNWPTELQYGWFNSLIDDDSLSDIKMDVSMHIHPIRKEFATTYLQDKFAAAASDAAAEQERGKVKQANQEIYQRQQDTAQLMMNMLKNGNENMFQVSLVIGIYGQNKWAYDDDGNEYLEKDAHQDLVEKTNRFKKVLAKNSQGGFGLKPLLHQQRDGIKSLMPMGYGGLHAFQNFYTSALATSYPFTQGNMQVENGILFGLQLPSSQPVFFNPFDRKWLHSYNGLVVGSMGSGKSAYAKTLLGRLALQGTQLFIIDPANNAGGEYTNLATSLDGTIIDFGGKDGIYLNPFELSIPSTWHKGNATDSRQASSIFKAKKEYLSNLIDIMADQFMEGSDAASVFGPARAKIPFVLDAILNAVYVTSGISIGGTRFTYDQWTPKKMPTLTDFYNLVSEYDKNLGLYQTRDQIMAWGQQNLRDGTLINKSSKADKIMFAYYNYIIRSNNEVWKKEEHDAVHLLRNILEPFMAGEDGEEMSPKAALFHGERKADLSNQCIVFRFGGKDNNEQIKELAIFMCFELINQRVTAVTTNSVYKNKLVVLDEAWKLIKTKSARAYVEKFCREGRKANTGIWLISQSYMDFQGENAVFADLAEMQIILSVPENEVSLLIEDLGLSSSIADMINSDKSKHTPGTGVFAIKGRIKKKIPIYNYMSPLETQIADTADATKPPMKISDFIPPEEMEKLGIKDEDAAGYGAIYGDD